MAVQARDVLDRAQNLIQDQTGIRWPLPELAMWLNDGAREVAIHKPSATAESTVLPLVHGTRQTIPTGDLQLLRIIRNLKGDSTDSERIGGRAVRLVNRDVLDTQRPDWHDEDRETFTIEVKHFVFDEADPRAFYVFPGNDGSGKVEALVAKAPAPIDETGQSLVDYAFALPVPDVYANALLDYILYRCYSKDASFAENAERAASHFQAFAASVGIKATHEVSSGPTTAGYRVTRDA